jgi:hypothetical protein
MGKMGVSLLNALTGGELKTRQVMILVVAMFRGTEEAVSPQEERRCANCEFWKQRRGVPTSGFCQKNAPLPEVHSPRTTLYVTWPITLEDDWCGQFQQRRDTMTRTR